MMGKIYDDGIRKSLASPTRNCAKLQRPTRSKQAGMRVSHLRSRVADEETPALATKS